jgi:hypothetical protein
LEKVTSRAEAHLRRALELLAACRDDCTEAIMLALRSDRDFCANFAPILGVIDMMG